MVLDTRYSEGAILAQHDSCHVQFHWPFSKPLGLLFQGKFYERFNGSCLILIMVLVFVDLYWEFEI